MNRFNTFQTRMTLLMIAGVYPVVTAYLYILMPLTGGWQMWQRTLVLVPIMVITIVFGLTPAIQKRFNRFLSGKPHMPGA